jgi:rhomboid protease GluP
MSHPFDRPPTSFTPPDDVPTISEDMLDHRVDFERGMSMVPLVGLALILACVIVFTLQIANGLLNIGEERQWVQMGALHQKLVMHGEFWRLVSCIFMHGSVEHLVGNLIMLYVLGIGCEHAFGRRRMLAMYLFCGLGGSLISVTFNDKPSVGASGAIFGLAGILPSLFWRHRAWIEVRDHRVGYVVAIWAVYQIALGVLNPQVDNYAHLGGFLTGVVCGLLARPKLRPTSHLQEYQQPSDVLAWAGLAVSAGVLGYGFAFLLPRLI